MSRRIARGPRGLVPLLPRLLAVLSVGALSLALPVGAQELPEDEATVAFVGVDLDGEGLRVRLQWSEDEGTLPEYAQLVSYDGRGEANDLVEVFPEPGAVIELRLPDALREPWESGWTQRLVVEDPWRGETLAVQFYDLKLDCQESEEQCVLGVAPASGTNEEVVHLSAEFDETLARIESSYEGMEFDLWAMVSAETPHLRGDALLYSHQVLRRLPYWGECFCVWSSGTSLSPSGFAQAISDSTSGGLVTGTRGPGAVGSLTVRAASRLGISFHLEGSNDLRLRPSCFRWFQYDDWRVVVRFPGGGREWFIPFPRPYLMPCGYSCSARYDHAGRLSGKSFVTYTDGTAVATAFVESFYRVDGGDQLYGVADQSAEFDDATVLSVWSAGGTTSSVSSALGVSAMRTVPASNAAANARNGFFAAIFGEPNLCWTGPFGPGAVWTHGTLQGPTQTQSLRQGVRDFFAERGVDIVP
ncbi:hypothetical protein LY474_00990 [Myxococcus stipitatus]|uniref:hypothetical protein n=1 Tax=Myxococcus stipitatus TaxID=83455 RepID=UPI001F1E1251|nr:hypothetical protein [Myxococcus stipitatus]MCE9666373.1 hypothetical protein [Myxococcus stipitatus]